MLTKDVKEFRLGHILAVFLGFDLLVGGEKFALEPILNFVFGGAVDSRARGIAVTECQRELLKQFQQFTSPSFFLEMSRLSNLVNQLSPDLDVMSAVSHWCLEQVSVYGDSFQVRQIRSTFIFLDGVDRFVIADRTRGQDASLN